MPLGRLLWLIPYSLGRIQAHPLHISRSPTIVAHHSAPIRHLLCSRTVRCKVTRLATLETLGATLSTRSSLTRTGATNSCKAVPGARGRASTTTSSKTTPGTRTIARSVLLSLPWATHATGTRWTRDRKPGSEGQLGLPLGVTTHILVILLFKAGSHLDNLSYRHTAAAHHLHPQAGLKAFQKSLRPPFLRIKGLGEPLRLGC